MLKTISIAPDLGSYRKSSDKKLAFIKPNFFMPDFFIPKVQIAFIQLLKAFIKASIFYYFDLKRYIQIDTNASGYAIDRVLNQITLNLLSSYLVTSDQIPFQFKNDL